MTTAAPDRSDPDVRALERFEHDRARDRAGRFGCAWVLIAAAAAAPFTVEPLTGDPGATVGAVVGALVLVALAAAVWPHDWSAAEAIDGLRAEAAALELAARESHARERDEVEQREHEETLRRVDDAAAEYERAAEERVRRELAAEEAAESAAKAEALARALRRP